MDQILKVLSVCESQNSDADQLEYQPRQPPEPLPTLHKRHRICLSSTKSNFQHSHHPVQAIVRRVRRDADPDLQVTLPRTTRATSVVGTPHPLQSEHLAGASRVSCAARADRSPRHLQQGR